MQNWPVELLLVSLFILRNWPSVSGFGFYSTLSARIENEIENNECQAVIKCTFLLIQFSFCFSFACAEQQPLTRIPLSLSAGDIEMHKHGYVSQPQKKY